MTGAKKTTFSGGGGILNNSDATIKEVEFTFDPPFFTNASRHLHAVITFQEDGKDGLTEQPFFVGGTEEEVVADGRSFIFNDPSRKIGRGTAFADFIESLDATEHEGSVIEGEDGTRDYSPLVGARVRVVQQPLSAAELAKLALKGKKTYRIDKKDPSKQWPLTKTVVSKFYSQEKAEPVKAAVPVAAKGRTMADVKAQLAQRRKTA